MSQVCKRKAVVSVLWTEVLAAVTPIVCSLNVIRKSVTITSSAPQKRLEVDSRGSISCTCHPFPTVKHVRRKECTTPKRISIIIKKTLRGTIAQGSLGFHNLSFRLERSGEHHNNTHPSRNLPWQTPLCVSGDCGVHLHCPSVHCDPVMILTQSRSSWHASAGIN